MARSMRSEGRRPKSISTASCTASKAGSFTDRKLDTDIPDLKFSWCSDSASEDGESNAGMLAAVFGNCGSSKPVDVALFLLPMETGVFPAGVISPPSSSNGSKQPCQSQVPTMREPGVLQTGLWLCSKRPHGLIDLHDTDRIWRFSSRR